MDHEVTARELAARQREAAEDLRLSAERTRQALLQSYELLRKTKPVLPYSPADRTGRFMPYFSPYRR